MTSELEQEPINEAPVALAEELAHQSEQYTAAEDAERRAENPDENVFTGGDPVKENAAIKAYAREVEVAKADYLASKEETASLKKTFDSKSDTLLTMIRRLDGASSTDQPFLKVVDPDETIEQRRARMVTQLREQKQCYVSEDDLAALERFDLDTLDQWLAMSPGPVFPGLLARAHVAATAGDDGAHCVKCGAALGRLSDTEDYPEKAFVGLACDGEPPAEPARTLPKRHAKKRTKKAA